MEWDLWEALSEIDNDLLMTPPPKRRRFRKLPLRVALVAAVLTLLAGTALAVGLGVGVHYGKNTVTLRGISLTEEAVQEQHYYSAKIQYNMHPTELRDLDFFTDALTDAWAKHSGEKRYDLVDPQGKPQNLGSISKAEALLGVDLMESRELNQRIRGVFVTMVVCDPQKAAGEYAVKGEIQPDGLVVYLSLRLGALSDSALDAQLVCEGGITVLIPLTEDFISLEGTQSLYSYESFGAFTESGLMTHDGMSLLLLENGNEKTGQTGYGIWCDQGLGYLAHLRTHPKGYATPLSLLAPLLQEIE